MRNDLTLQSVLNAIRDEKIEFLRGVYEHFGCSPSTFYVYFPTNSAYLKRIREELNLNKRRITSKSNVSKELSKKFTGTGYIYLIQCIPFNYYKIGISKIKPKMRMSALQTGSPFELKILDIYLIDDYTKREVQLHRKYKEKNVRGEWFLFEDDELELLKTELESYENEVEQVSFL